MKLKVKVTPEESKKIQEILFRMGYRWDGDSKKVAHTNMPYLYVYNTKWLGYTRYLDNFNSHPFKEVAPGYFEAFETKLWKVLNEY